MSKFEATEIHTLLTPVVWVNGPIVMCPNENNKLRVTSGESKLLGSAGQQPRFELDYGTRKCGS